MASDVIVPEVGELGMEVTFVRWLKAVGDEVVVGDPLFEVDTDKSVMVVEAYAAGTLADIGANEGDIVAPRDVIGRIVAEGERLADREAGSPASSSTAALANVSAAGQSAGTVASSSVPAAGPAPLAGRGRVSPRARRVAKQLGVDPTELSGSGPDGLVTEADVRAAAEEGGAASELAQEPARPESARPESARPDPRERARKAIADLTTASWQSIPHFYLDLEADVDRALALAKPTPLVLAAVAQALVRHPDCNLTWDGDRPVRRDGVDLGLLVDTEHGLLIAVINDAQELSLAGMSDAIRDAAERARSGRLQAADMGPRSLTVSNLGMYSVDRFSAVIPRPDVLTLAVGRTRTVPRWDGSSFQPRRVMDLTLSVDHRALDGAAAARLLSSLEAVLLDPVAEGLA